MATPVKEKSFASDASVRLPKPYILRRLHSLMGLWLAIYLCEHLFVNSQAAFLGLDDGAGFVRLVNKIHSLSYLKVIEVVFLGLPFAIHMVWGIRYALTSKLNSAGRSNTQPNLSQYRRNRAFSWQRITSWVLLVGVILHVVHMRFIIYPTHSERGLEKSYFARLSVDPKLYGVSEKLGAEIFSHKALEEKEVAIAEKMAKLKGEEEGQSRYLLESDIKEDQEWLEAANQWSLKPGEVLAEAPTAGVIFLLIVRNTFKSPLMVGLYSLFVIAAVYHGFNGLWTFLITWGVTLTRRSQMWMRRVAFGLMWVVMALGLISAWGLFIAVQ